MSRTLAALLAAAVVSLAGCSSSGEPAAAPTVTATATTTVLVPASPAATGPAAADVSDFFTAEENDFIDSVRQDATLAKTIPGTLVGTGRAVCNRLRIGQSVKLIGRWLTSGVDWTDYEAGFLIGAAGRTLCPADFAAATS